MRPSRYRAMLRLVRAAISSCGIDDAVELIGSLVIKAMEDERGHEQLEDARRAGRDRQRRFRDRHSGVTSTVTAGVTSSVTEAVTSTVTSATEIAQMGEITTSGPEIRSLEGGLGGVSPSGPLFSGSDPAVTSASSLPPDLSNGQSLVARVTRERRRVPRVPVYPAEFSAFWEVIGVGGKADALKAWEQAGEPVADVVLACWKRWTDALWSDGIGVPYTATWLRRSDWREEPRPRPTANKAYVREANNHAAMQKTMDLISAHERGRR